MDVDVDRLRVVVNVVDDLSRALSLLFHRGALHRTLAFLHVCVFFFLPF